MCLGKSFPEMCHQKTARSLHPATLTWLMVMYMVRKKILLVIGYTGMLRAKICGYVLLLGMANGDAGHNQNTDVESAMEGSQAMEIEEATANHVESEGSNKHEHGEEDQDSVRSPKRIKIETDDNQETAQTTNDDVPVPESEQANDAEQTTEESVAHVLDDEDEVPVKKEKPAVIEERQGLIEFRVFTNDGTRESMILLTGMKNLFQKQLPKMPREYIARLVYDRYVCCPWASNVLCS